MVNMDHKFSRVETQSSNSVSAYVDPIPVDLLIDIFSRVPAKSITRFRCLWRSILQRSDFTELFLTISLTRPRLLFAAEVDKELVFYSSPQPQNLDETCSIVATRYQTSFPTHFPKRITQLSKRSSTGLVLFQEYEYGRNNLVICNPATGESVTLPNVQTKIERTYAGYDPINKQLKVLCVTSSNTQLVLTLETGTLLWRTVECKFNYKWKWYPNINNETCINGVIYFASSFQGSPMIVCFEIRSEKFGFIKVDEDILLHSYDANGLVSYMLLVNYKGKLGVCKLPNRYDKPLQLVFVSWVLEDVKENKWSKRVYELPPGGKEIVCGGTYYVGMTDAGEMVFASYRASEPHVYLFYYSLERNTITRVNFHGSKEFLDHTIPTHTFLNYVENLKLM